MALSEFSLIEKYFKRAPHSDKVLLGVGDDCALVRLGSDDVQALSMDTLVEGVHFPVATNAADIGYKSLAVNLSDLAAMGAQPAWFSLALSLPKAEEAWLADFSEGLFALATEHQLPLIGGDITRGPLTITIQIAGTVAEQSALKRSGALVGDDIYVSGTIGDAALGLCLVQGESKSFAVQSAQAESHLLFRLNRPTPRIALGIALREVANSCIDLSDGLLADLTHICDSSGVGARLALSEIPVSLAWRDCVNTMTVSADQRIQLLLSGGDDYELCFTAPEARRSTISGLAARLNIPLARIGKVLKQGLVECYDDAGQLVASRSRGFQHF